MSKKFIYVSIFSLSWALAIFVNKIALNGGSKPIPYTIQTTLIGVVLLMTYLFLTKRAEIKKIDLVILKKLFFIGALIGFGNLLGISGLRLSASVNYGFLIKSTLVFTILFAFIFLRERMDKKKALLLLVFILGAYLITTGGKTIIPKIGDLLTVMAACCFSATAVFQKQLVKKVSPEIIGGGRNFFALLVLLFLVPFIKTEVLEIISPHLVIISGALGAIITVSLNKTLSVATASYMTMMSMSVPVINALLGTVFLKESMNIFQITGGILIVSSGILVNKWKI